MPDHVSLSYLLIKLHVLLFSDKGAFSLCVYGGKSRCTSERAMTNKDQSGLASEWGEAEWEPGGEWVSEGHFWV